jgi:hypothetical protein
VTASPAARLAQAQAGRKTATIIAVVVFFLFVIVAPLSIIPGGGFRKKSELVFIFALTAVVGLGLAVSVKVSLNKKAKERLDKDLGPLDRPK